MLWAFSFLEYLVEIKNKHAYNGIFFNKKRLFQGTTKWEIKFLFLIVYKKMIISDAIAKFRLSQSPEPSISVRLSIKMSRVLIKYSYKI